MIVSTKSEDFPKISSGELHVWHISTIVSSDEFATYKNTLSKNELKKVHFFEFDNVRDAYVVSQGALRKLLSGYLGIPSMMVKFGRGQKGKPYSVDNPNLYFNLTNSGKHVAIAFSFDGEVGIDIEQIRPLPDLDMLIQKNFTAREIKFITAKPEEKLKRFFRFWTLKESYLKAIGEGMRLTPDNIEFNIENDRITQLSIKGIFEQEDWYFKEFSSPMDYVGTITCGQDNTVIKQMEFRSFTS